MSLSKTKSTSLLFILMLPVLAFSQIDFDIKNWQHLDPVNDQVFGVSSSKLYASMPNQTNKKKVIVAVIDSGVDIKHEDLDNKIWTNDDEIPNNGIDDDQNGYIDDVHGWNFIGGKDGKNVAFDTYEMVRLYNVAKEKFEHLDPAEISKKDEPAYDQYIEWKEKIEKELSSSEKNYEETLKYEFIVSSALDALAEALGDKPLNKANVDALSDDGNVSLTIGKQIMDQIYASGAEVESIADIKSEFLSDVEEQKDYYGNRFKYNYNPDFDPREIVGDNYDNPFEKYYGNNDVTGPDAFHGTHVAGIIGAERNNGFGMDGIAEAVEIMSIRTVPDGDERDKDVANAIIYAVDNGASIINMSFGKGDSPYKEAVDKAVKYAEKNDVLLVHAAGNAAMDNDEGANYPNDLFAKRGLFSRKRAKNWIEVGALSWQKGEDAIAPFSNYGKEQVDLFAPGVTIYSTTPGSKYKEADGTSMAAPVVSGVAAIIRANFPNLSAKDVKNILLESSKKFDRTVKLPGTDELVDFPSLSQTGGVVNAYEAYALAQAKAKEGTNKTKKGKSDSKANKQKKAVRT